MKIFFAWRPLEIPVGCLVEYSLHLMGKQISLQAWSAITSDAVSIKILLSFTILKMTILGWRQEGYPAIKIYFIRIYEMTKSIDRSNCVNRIELYKNKMIYRV